MEISVRFLFGLLSIVALVAACLLLVAGHGYDALVTAVLFVGLVNGAAWPRTP